MEQLIYKLLIALFGITGMMVAWVIIQRLWLKAFPDHHIEEDVLAGRSDCGSCGCTTRCVNKLKSTDRT